MSSGELSSNFLPPEAARRTALVTTTLYPKFNLDSSDPHDVDTVRGRLALMTLEAAFEQGLQISLVEDGSSLDFIKALKNMGLDYLKGGLGMAQGRRMNFRHASEMPGVDYYFWAEAEKVSLVRYCLPLFIASLLSGDADMVVANRDKDSYETYPPYQLETELKANRLMNASLRRHGVWPGNKKSIDFLFAPRAYVNNNRNLRYLTERFENTNTERTRGTRNFINFDRWPASIVIPVARALYDGSRNGQKLVEIAEVPYRHPPEQTASEIDSPELTRKRWEQYTHFIYSLERTLMFCEGNPNSGVRIAA